MIDSIELIVKLKSQRRTNEVFVSKRLFQQLVEESNEVRTVSELKMNCPYESNLYRFCHRARWDGLTFICLTQVPLSLLSAT